MDCMIKILEQACRLMILLHEYKKCVLIRVTSSCDSVQLIFAPPCMFLYGHDLLNKIIIILYKYIIDNALKI